MPLVKEGKIGGVKKEYVYAGAGLAGIVLVAVYVRSKKNAAAAAQNANMVTDPAGNQCAALSPTSGYCPGTPQDLAYTGQGANLAGQNSASYVGGQIIGYDQYGNPIYSSGPGPTGPGSFTNNAEWAQAAVQYLMNVDQNSSPDVISAALGVYIDGAAPTEAQLSIIQQAIAFEGLPPVAGTDGYPPNIRNTQSGGGGNPPPGGGGPPPHSKTKPGPITNLRTQMVSPTTVSVSWHPTTNDATSYLFQITPKDSTSHNIGNRTEYDAGDLKTDQTYTAHVAGVNQYGHGPWATTTFKTSSSGHPPWKGGTVPIGGQK